MQKYCLIILTLFLFGCNYSGGIKAKRLADTLAELKKKANFKPLNQQEAYAFINNYYLPRLDSLQTKRKIFIHPVTGIDFDELFNADSVKLEKEYSENKGSNSALTPPTPPSLIFDKKFNWDSKKLLKAVVIKDYTLLNVGSSTNNNSYNNVDSSKAWHHKYGYGYTCVSYPQYNPYTKRLVIREWIENDYFCGTGRETKFWFTKTSAGWKADSYNWFVKVYK